MNTKNLILMLSVVVLGFTSCCNNATKTTATLKTEADTACYYIGYMNGTMLTRNGLDKPNVEAIIAGMNTALQKKKAPADLMEMQQFLGNYIQKVMTAKAEETLKKGEAFLAENAKKEGVKTTESGLQYKIEKEGTGAIPSDTSIVKVHYKGTFINGEEFDSSYKHNKPAEFPVNGVIRGWTEALKMMPVGSKWTLYLPSKLAYGPRGTNGGPIGPNEALVFEVELLEIVSPAAK
ncbi:FKBP-type peptidyl-prolyl cis-trans isomerase [Gabonibacter chumensis]|uniref:FKBP-type peptidyl-prolyl cis-trans isomerase n=1 Tax=Gabonibacter chumensis TaxID=2972474 RepID=UPI002573C335|nr:FKBP-type peptidyl-prolyl cis-trans isomerase [Gabonibacter chumensis]MCR9013250.1 FKBP-type peptidyl-prolyl cis-trans isomerase [Gabonibacter chumensis]